MGPLLAHVTCGAYSMKELQRELGAWKTSSKISVRFHHPRAGNAADYDTVCSYLTDSKYKIKIVDGNPVIGEESEAERMERLGYFWFEFGQGWVGGNILDLPAYRFSPMYKVTDKRTDKSAKLLEECRL